VRKENLQKAYEGFSRASVMPQLIDILEQTSTTPAIGATAVSQSTV